MSEKTYIDLGQVTAYAYAKAHGYTGTEEEFGIEQAQFAQNAQQVAEDRVVVREDRTHVDDVVETFTETTAPEAVQRVTTEGDTQVARVQGVGNAAVQDVTDTKDQALQDIDDAGDSEVGDIQAEGNTQVGRVRAEGTTQVNTVTQTGTTQVGLVQAEGNTQVQNVEDKGQEIIDSLPPNYEEDMAQVEDFLENLVKVSDTQPESEANKLWIEDQAEEEIEVPTYEEFESLSNDVSDAKNAISELANWQEIDVSFYGILTASVNASTGVISSTSKCRTIYFDCKKNTKYKITKPAGGRFSVSLSTVPAAYGVTVYNQIVDNTATSIEITTDNQALYIVAFVYYSETDTGYTGVEMCNAIKVYQYAAIPIYPEGGYTFSQDDRTIYGDYNYAFRKYEKEYSGQSLQALVYHNRERCIFFADGTVRLINPYGVPESKTFTSFSHPQFAELLHDHTYLVTTTVDSGLQTEYRAAFVYDFDTNASSETIIPTITGNLLAVSQIDSDNYYVVVWEGTANVLKFYKWVKSADTSTLLGTVTLNRTYFQGGCRIGNLFYIMNNDGSNLSRTQIVSTVDLDNIQLNDAIFFKGFGELEGFSVACADDGSAYAHFGDNRKKYLYTVRLR